MLRHSPRLRGNQIAVSFVDSSPGIPASFQMLGAKDANRRSERA